MSRSTLVLVAALLGGTAVLLGAFGAHGLEDRFVTGEHDGKAWWEIGVRYHMWHALALFALAGVARRPGRVVPIAFVLGTLGFSGSLYAMAVGSPSSIWGPITPLGGTLYLVGWTAVIVRAARGEFTGSSPLDGSDGAKKAPGRGRGEGGRGEGGGAEGGVA